MQQACAILQGRHDYTTFKVTSDPAPAVRTVDELKVVRDEADMFSVHPHAAHSHQKFTIMAKSRSFMTHQVRKMVAAVVGCGMGVMTPAKVAQILEARNPALCPTMAPPNGLYLTNIVYPPHQIFESSAETFDALHEHLDAVSWNRHGKPRMRRVLTAEYEESN
jgi:tRNA pseudouridine38-40 synthase